MNQTKPGTASTILLLNYFILHIMINLLTDLINRLNEWLDAWIKWRLEKLAPLYLHL